MSVYLTPERLLTMPTGVSLEGYSQLELAGIITDASAIADAYCNLATVPQPGSLRGGVVIDEEHKWDYSMYGWDQGTRRVFLFQHPVRSVEQFKLLVAAGAVAEIPSNTLVINHTERWVEVTALAIASNSGLFGVTGWIVPIGGLNNPMAQISYTYGRVIDEVDEKLYPITDDNTTVFQAANGFWVAGAPVEVTEDGNVMDPDDYTVDRDVGRVTFDDGVAGVIRASYSHEMDAAIPSAVGHICAEIAGRASSKAKGLTGGIGRIKVGEITIDRSMSAKEAGQSLDVTVPEAASLLNAYRVMWMA